MIIRLASAAMLIVAISGCATPTANQKALATASIVHSDGSPAGTASIRANGNGLALTLDLKGMPAGEHGMHLHTTGACDGPGFTSAGGHLNPAGHKHGSLNPAGKHLGDLPNITIAANGTAHLTTALDGNAADLETALFDSDGTAIVVHATADDYMTDPSGNSGARIACGVFKKP